MKNIKIIRIFTFVLVFASAGIIFTNWHIQGQKQEPTQNKPKQEIQDDDNDTSQYPIVRFDKPEPIDNKEREKKGKKDKRYDKFQLITKKPPSESVGVALYDEMPPPPAIPTTQSEVILIGEVLNAEAILTANRASVYSEFTVRVDEVLKNSDSSQIIQGSQITFDMVGGSVFYPNGHKVTYSVMEKPLPRVGRRYVLFLNNTDESLNFNILIGYELKNGKIYPLFSSSPFRKFRGANETDFITVIRGTLTQPSQQVNN